MIKILYTPDFRVGYIMAVYFKEITSKYKYVFYMVEVQMECGPYRDQWVKFNTTSFGNISRKL